MQSTFGSSSLVRLLGGWAPVTGEAPGMDFAERLSLSLSAFDAIGLQSAHQSIKAITAPASGKAPPAQPGEVHSVEQDVRRVRAALDDAIAQDPLPLAAVDVAQADAAVYRQRHLELQRRMEQMIGLLRGHVRRRVSRISPRLRRLATLDAALEHWLAPREQAVLSAVVALAERRFEQRRGEHRQALASAAGSDDPALWRRPGGWLQAFESDWRLALAAELDLRLQPVAGLLEAINESKHQA